MADGGGAPNLAEQTNHLSTTQQKKRILTFTPGTSDNRANKHPIHRFTITQNPVPTNSIKTVKSKRRQNEED
jgi:hypothetical protein